MGNDFTKLVPARKPCAACWRQQKVKPRCLALVEPKGQKMVIDLQGKLEKEVERFKSTVCKFKSADDKINHEEFDDLRTQLSEKNIDASVFSMEGIDKGANFFMDKTELVESYQELLETRRDKLYRLMAPGSDFNQKLGNVWRYVDADNSGEVDRREARKLLQEYALQMSHSSVNEDDVESRFNRFDIDKSGALSKDEFKAFVECSFFELLVMPHKSR
mmetsp:Transcript_158542/g.279962  ORF Transcript_158542/g.279962 Transcript_158542/m.279962 type:complete len:218 (-) Transcript_158542:60-713(-)